jgi:hypothetical protein
MPILPIVPALTACTGTTETDDATTAFLTSTAERYYSVTAAAIRAADPNHLILGNREVAPGSGRVVGMHWFQWLYQPHEGRMGKTTTGAS